MKNWKDEKYKLYNIQAFWQCNHDLSLISGTNRNYRQSRSLDLRNNVNSLHFLSKILLDYYTFQSKQKFV